MSSLNQLFDTLSAWVNEQTVQHRRQNIPAAMSSIERLEPRALLTATLSATVNTSGNLTITDTDGTKDNNIVVTKSGAAFVFTDAAESFAAAPTGGTLSNFNRTLTINVAGTITINGGGGNNTLTDGTGNNITYDVTGANSGSTTAITSFTGFQNLFGGSAQTQTFVVENNGSIGSVKGNAVGATLQVIKTAGATFYLSSAITVGVDSGSATGVSSFTQVANLKGSAANDTLNATVGYATLEGIVDLGGGDNTFNVASSNAVQGGLQAGDGKNQVNIDGGVGGFGVKLGNGQNNVQVMGNSFVTNVTAGDGGNIVTVDGFLLGNIGLGSGNDSVTINGQFGGAIDGGGGTNTLTARSFIINGADRGAFSDVTKSFGSFQSIQNLVGGGDNDTFTFTGNGSLTGTIDGGAGTNTIQVAIPGQAIIVTNSGPNKGSLFRSADTQPNSSLLNTAKLGTDGFVNIQSVVAQPLVTATAASNLAATSATIGGNISSDGGATITKRGVLYAKTSDNANPTLGGTGVTEVDDPTNGTGSFSENITGLTPLTGYSFVAFATNSVGTTYSGPVSTFKTPETPSLTVTSDQDVVDAFDGKTSLREAIAYAATLTGPQTITFGNGSAVGGINFTDGQAHTITLTGGQINITSSVTIQGQGNAKTVIDGGWSGGSANDGSRIFKINDGTATQQTVTINDVTLQHANAGTGNFIFNGGAIQNSERLFLNRDVITGNQGNQGGGIANFGVVISTGDIFSGNVAPTGGGGIQNSSSGIFTSINDAVVNNNKLVHADGGGIYNVGIGFNLINGTVANNSGISGGGIINFGTLNVTNSTIANNSATQGGGLFHGIGDTWNMSNSILADNTGGDVFVNGQTSTTAKFSIIGDRSYSGPGVLNQQTLTAAQLFVTDNSGHARLANNGGPTPTIALSANSVALDAGSNALAVDANNAPLAKDQRGQSRIAAGTVDLGAFESQTIAVSFSVQDKTYDGKAIVNPQVTTLPIGPAAAGSSLNLTFTYYSGSTANPANVLTGPPTNAGSYLLVVTASQDGYHTGTAQAAFKINKANATISVTPYNVPYDGQPHTATGTAKGVNGETLAGLDLSKTSHTLAGNYTGDSWSFTDVTGNYNNVAATTIADQISRLSPTLTLTPGPQLILGSGAKFSASATLAGGVGETGKLTFVLTNSAGTALFTQDVIVNGDGTYAPTNVLAATVAGTYFWAVSYNGDQNHFGATVAKGPATTESVIGLGITNNNGALYVVGTGAGDTVVVTAIGTQTDGSTGVRVVSTLNGVSTTTTYNAPVTSLNFFEFGSFGKILLPDNLMAIPTFTTLGEGTYNVHLSNANAKVIAGNGNFNQITVGNGMNSITVGNGGGTKIIAGNGSNTITIGNGNSNSIFAGNGNNVIVEGNGMTNAITVGNGNNFIVGGLGSHNILTGSGTNIVINGAATLTSASDSFSSILNDFVAGKAPAVGAIRPRLKITYATVAGSKLVVGAGLNWFFVNNPSTFTNRKATDVLTNS